MQPSVRGRIQSGREGIWSRRVRPEKRKPRRCRRGFAFTSSCARIASGACNVPRLRVKSRSTGAAVSSLKRHLNVRSGRFKSRPPHALIESRLNYYYQISFDWTTSFLSDTTIVASDTSLSRCFARFCNPWRAQPPTKDRSVAVAAQSSHDSGLRPKKRPVLLRAAGLGFRIRS